MQRFTWNMTSPRHALWVAALLLATMGGCRASEVSRLPDSASESARRHASSCDEGDPNGCFALGLVYAMGQTAAQGVERDEEHATSLLERACAGGVDAACELVEVLQADGALEAGSGSSLPTPAAPPSR